MIFPSSYCQKKSLFAVQYLQSVRLLTIIKEKKETQKNQNQNRRDNWRRSSRGWHWYKKPRGFWTTVVTETQSLREKSGWWWWWGWGEGGGEDSKLPARAKWRRLLRYFYKNHKEPVVHRQEWPVFFRFHGVVLTMRSNPIGASECFSWASFVTA